MVMDIIVIKNSRSAKVSFLGLHNISSVLPEHQDLIKCALGEAYTLQYIL
jgi:hypothetical protein